MGFSRRQGDKRRQRIKQKKRKGKKKKEREEERKLRNLRQQLRSPNHEIASKQNSAGFMGDKRMKRKKARPNTKDLLNEDY